MTFKDNSRLHYSFHYQNFFPCNAGLVAGVYASMEYGKERVRGKNDWVNDKPNIYCFHFLVPPLR